MNSLSRALVVVAALGTAAWAIRDAHAGNFDQALQTTATGFYDVSFVTGQFADFTGVSGRVTVDDVTFDVQIRPNRLAYPFVPPNAPPDPNKASPWFTTDDMFWTTWGPPLHGAQTPANPGGFLLLMNNELIKWMVPLAHWDVVALHDWDGTTIGGAQIIDRASWSTYGEFAGAMSTGTQFIPGNDEPPQVNFEAVDALVPSIALSMFCVPTSQSRHYQTPHFLQQGHLHFSKNPWTFIPSASVVVKGRTNVDDPAIGLVTVPIGGTEGVGP